MHGISLPTPCMQGYQYICTSPLVLWCIASLHHYEYLVLWATPSTSGYLVYSPHVMCHVSSHTPWDMYTPTLATTPVYRYVLLVCTHGILYAAKDVCTSCYTPSMASPLGWVDALAVSTDAYTRSLHNMGWCYLCTSYFLWLGTTLRRCLATWDASLH